MTAALNTFAVVSGGSFAIKPPAYVDNRVLAAGVAETCTIPTVGGRKATIVLITSTEDVYAAYTPTGASTVVAAVPAADITDGTGCELNPVSRYVTGYDSISIISENACKVSLAYFIQ